MKTADLLALMDREIEQLVADNNHSAAAIMREAAEQLRGYLTHPKRAMGGPVAGSFCIGDGSEETFRGPPPPPNR
jgi:hypothetical protein